MEVFSWRWIWPLMKRWLWQKLMVGFGCDTIPILPYNHNTWIWVGLNWKLMYFSMGSLWTSVIEVMPEKLPPPHLNWSTWKRLCSPRLTDVSLLGGPARIGEVPVLGYVIERFRSIIRILSMIIQDCPWRMYRMLWWKCTPSAECKTIRVAASAVMDGWDGHTVPSSDVF